MSAPLLLTTPSATRHQAPDVVCPACGYQLQPWEVHLLKYLACSFCGSHLEIAASVDVQVAAS